MAYTVSSVDTALQLLEAIADNPKIGVTELAGKTGNTKSQVFRLLYTLESRGYVRKDPSSRTYTLGYQAMYIGEHSKKQINLLEIAQPYLEQLGTLSRENVHLIVREKARSVCIALQESPQDLRLYAQVGRRGPLHAGGGSKVLLAYAPPELQETVLTGPLEAFTSATITDPQQLRHVLRQIINEGYHIATSDLDEGAFSIAAPIFDYANTVVAALSIAGPVYRLSDEMLANHQQLVMEFSRKISEALGWKPPLL